MEEELSSVHIVQDKVELRASLEGIMEADKERVCEILQQDIPLCHDVFHFVPSDNRLLLEHLDGIVVTSQFMPTKIHLYMFKGQPNYS